jgi:hypothetical protein
MGMLDVCLVEARTVRASFEGGRVSTAVSALGARNTNSL